MTLEYTDDDCTYDTGYGDYGATLTVEYKPIVEDTSFDHAFGTKTQQHVTDIEIVYANIHAIGNNGDDVYCGDEDLDEESVFDYVTKEKLINHANEQLNKGEL